MLKTLRIDVNYAQNWVMVETNPGTDLTVNLPGNGGVTGEKARSH
jgi:hypothetical protein